MARVYLGRPPPKPSSAHTPVRSRTYLCTLLFCALLSAQALMPFAHARESLPHSPPSTAIKSATGPAMVIGGALRDDNSAVWSRLVDLAGGPGARFVVLATASGDPEAAARGTIAALTAHGAVAEDLRVAPELKGVDLARPCVTRQSSRRCCGHRGVLHRWRSGPHRGFAAPGRSRVAAADGDP